MGDQVKKVNIDKDAITSEELNAVISAPTFELKTSKTNCQLEKNCRSNECMGQL